jgi:hypothetical protein
MIVFLFVLLFCVADGGLVRRIRNSSDVTTSANEDVSVTSDPVSFVRYYHVGQHRDVVREHYLGNFSAPTHMIYDPVKLSNLAVESVHESFALPASFAQLLNTSDADSKKSDDMEDDDEEPVALDEVRGSLDTTDEEVRGWISKACFYVGDSASRTPGDDPKTYPDLSDVCNADVIEGKNNRCCVCPHMIKAIRPGMNTAATKSEAAREKCTERLGKGWLHEGGLCLKSGTVLKAMTSLGMGKGCIDR